MAIYDVNAAIDKPNFLNSFRQGQQYGQQLRQQQQQQQDRNALRTLAPQIIAGDPNATAQGAAISPEQTAQYASAGEAQLRKLKGAIDYIDRAKQQGDPRAIEAAYQSVRPYLASHGQEPPATFAEAEPRMEEARAKIAMLGAQKTDNVTVSAGSAIVDPATGKVVYERPYAPEKPQNATFQVDQQGRGWWLAPGQPPVPADMPAQAAQPQTGGAAVTLEQAATSAGDPQAIQTDFRTLAGQFPGTQISSLQRTPEHNAEVGGVANSQHVRGTAGDFVVPPQARPEFIAAAKQHGYEAIDEGDHVHLELPPGGSRGGQGGGINFGKPKEVPEQYETMSAEQVRSLGLPDGTVAQRSPSGQVQIINKPRDLPSGGQVIDNGDGTTTYIPAGKLSDSQRNNAGFYQRMVNSDQELTKLEQRGYDPTNVRDYATVGGRFTNGLSSPEGQQYHQAAQNWVRANLRKESGAAIGVAEMDQEIRNYFPVFGDGPEVIAQKNNNRKVVEQAMRTAAGAALAPVSAPPGKPAQQAATSEGGAPMRATNPQTGQTIELRNGAWVTVQ